MNNDQDRDHNHNNEKKYVELEQIRVLLHSHRANIVSINFTRDDKYLLTLSDDRFIIWNTYDWTPLQIAVQASEKVDNLAIMAINDHCSSDKFACCYQSKIELYNLFIERKNDENNNIKLKRLVLNPSGNIRRLLNRTTNAVTYSAIAFNTWTNQHQRVLHASLSNGVVVSWNINNGQQLANFQAADEEITCLVTSHDNNHKLALGTISGTIRVLEISGLFQENLANNPQHQVEVIYDFNKLYNNPIQSLIIDKNVNLAIVGTHEGTAYYIDLNSPEESVRLISGGAGDTVICMAEKPDDRINDFRQNKKQNKIIATGHLSGSVRVYDADERELLLNFEIEEPEDPVIEQKNSRAQTNLSGFSESRMSNTNKSNKSLRSQKSLAGQSLQNISSSKSVQSNYSNSYGNLETCTTLKWLSSILDNDLDSAFINSFIAAGYSKGSIRIFDIDHNELVLRIKVFNCEVTAIELGIENSLVACAKNGTIAIINMTTGTTSKILTDHKGVPIDCISSIYNPDDNIQMLIVGARDSRFSIWEYRNANEVILLDWISTPTPPNYPDGTYFSSYLKEQDQLLEREMQQLQVENQAKNALPFSNTKRNKIQASAASIKSNNTISATSHATRSDISNATTAASTTNSITSNKNKIIWSKIPKSLCQITGNSTSSNNNGDAPTIVIYTCYSFNKEICLYHLAHKQNLRSIKINHWVTNLSVLASNYIITAVEGGLIQVVNISSGICYDVSGHTSKIQSLISVGKMRFLSSANNELLGWSLRKVKKIEFV